jgi:uncharacterized protein (DUF1697 family)
MHGTTMALIVFLRGINIGGHRKLRPAALAAELKSLDIVNIGAAGTFVIRRPITRAQLRAELSRQLPFDAGITICHGRELVAFLSQDPFRFQRTGPHVTRFVTVLARRPRTRPPLPLTFPSSGRWLLKVVGREQRFVFGLYRRDMKVIGYLGQLDRLFGVPGTTRNWNTIRAIVRALGGNDPSSYR